MEMYKVIKVDNFNRESVSDVLVKDNVSEEEGDNICKEKNKDCSDTSEWYYMCVSADYELWDAGKLY